MAKKEAVRKTEPRTTRKPARGGAGIGGGHGTGPGGGGGAGAGGKAGAVGSGGRAAADTDARSRNGRTRRVTILDVARAAGVSLGTVSRVINNNESVGRPLRDRVLNAARSLGYEPDAVAQSMRTQTTHAVGCMISDVSNPLFAAIVGAAEEVLRRSSYTMILANSGDSPEFERDILSLFRRRRLEGLMITLSDEREPAVMKLLEESDLPIVLIERECALPFDSVVADHYGGALQAVNYLLMLHHRRIGLITVTRAALPGRARGLAYEDAHRAANVPVDPDLVAFEGFSTDYGYRSAYRMLVSPDPPTAIIAGANQMVGVLKAVRALNIPVPGRLSLITVGDTDLASLYSPPLTAVRWQQEKVGAAAAELLLSRVTGAMSGQRQQRIVLPTELVLRQSCATPPPK